MEKLLVFGHLNPDTDAIASAITFAHYLNEIGVEAEAVALEAPNEETAYALNHFHTEAPRVIHTASNETKAVALVDHNEAQQSVSDIKDVEVKYVVDHHRISNFETTNPLFYRAEPLGCTNTIIYKMFREKGLEISVSLAGLMLSAIVSDTLLFKSPTCTNEDQEAAKELATLAGVDIEEYGLEMLKAGTNLTSKSNEELLDLDAKSFPMSDKSVRIAQVNTVDIDEVIERKEDLCTLMNTRNTTEGYDLFVLVITDIIESNSTILAVGDGVDVVKNAFHVDLEGHAAFLPGVVSRKKQVVPQLTKAYSK
ncbi:manganese-dependent inorganic pyrophosphatase [Jeotgalibaca sp. MA1X17-3]|uniref:manganese-dependent inorganic pyrophosphatase n=1 Tax=Jeotgalibaca sp. MA1X17-3 TaxID=2908211 RepID=UPI001F26DE55|nr:manganese-dependent inorganic pyrophosphatase [Jeotgalibaca sp. MA1X17-3]UJF14776.1 manganese-dependent inorganic pyrophosphatase [Jeotgalibaca sp. MA1X17-3]